MKPRTEYAKVAPDGLAAMLGLESYVHGSGLEAGLIELVKVRASQINGCAYCLDMHTKDARAAGEKEQRLYAVAAWHEAPFFSERERAALAWTEAVTLVGETHVPDEVYELARRHFVEKELVDLTLAIVAINVVTVSYGAMASKLETQIESIERQSEILKSSQTAALAMPRVQDQAAAEGMYLPEPDAIVYRSFQESDYEAAAARLAAGG